MTPAKSVSQSSFCAPLQSLHAKHNTALSVALLVIMAAGGILAGLAGVNAVPQAAGWAGCLTFVVSLIAAALVVCCPKKVPPKEIPKPTPTVTYFSLLELVNKGHAVEAWSQYLESCRQEPNSKKLPPYRLLEAMISYWEQQKVDIGTQISVELIQACALEYSDFSQRCLENEDLWSSLKAHPESINQIADKHPVFARKLMTSSRGAEIHNEHRLSIFRSGHAEILEAMTQHWLTQEHITYLFGYLLVYPDSISKEDFEKVKRIAEKAHNALSFFTDDPKETTYWTLFSNLMDVIVGKFYIQGIYKKENKLPPMLRHLPEVEIVTNLKKTLSAQCKDAEMCKTLLYLSLFQESDKEFAQARLLLGKLWLDVGNSKEAQDCFLEVASLNVQESEEASQLLKQFDK